MLDGELNPWALVCGWIPCPLLIALRTYFGHRAMSEKCQERKSVALLNHLVGASEQRRRQREAKCFGRLEIDRRADPNGLCAELLTSVGHN
jgi:hypothetical protein